MTILVAYATKHGATQTIAERIADTLRAKGLSADVRPVKDVEDVSRYEAFVIGGAVYFGSWLKDATTFVQQHQAVLADRPVWLFSSGPLGSQSTGPNGCDLREVSIPKEIGWVSEAIKPRDHRVFFGALEHTTFGPLERALWAMPGSHKVLIEGDFRDWADVEAWSETIAQQLTPMAAL